MLEGYFGGVFNPEKDKLYSATLVNIEDVDYGEFSYLHEQLLGHSSSHFDLERLKVFHPDGSWSNKTTEQCIDEGIYKYFSIKFIGVLFMDQWYIMESLSFYGDLIDEDSIKEDIVCHYNKRNFWNQALFKEHQPISFPRNGEIITARDVEYDEFKGMPDLVAILKKEKKDKVNRAYDRYFNEEFILPFFEKLRVTNPAEYKEFCGLRYGFTCIFPVHKNYTLFCCIAKNDKEMWRLHYFVYNPATRKYYKWLYPNPEFFDFSFFYSDQIIDDLRQISCWDDDAYLDSSCTMDDENFWNNYVFARNESGYLYLEET